MHIRKEESERGAISWPGLITASACSAASGAARHKDAKEASIWVAIN